MSLASYNTGQRTSGMRRMSLESTTPVVARCTTCFREESWTAEGVEVLVEGGHRQPPAQAWRAGWPAVKAWREGGAPIVGHCTACAQPMTSSSPGAVPLTGMTLELPFGTLTVGEWLTLTSEGGQPERVELAVLTERLEAVPRQTLRGFIGPVTTLPFLLFVIVLVVGMVLLWTWTASFFFSFIWNGFTTHGFTTGGGGGLPELPPL